MLFGSTRTTRKLLKELNEAKNVKPENANTVSQICIMYIDSETKQGIDGLCLSFAFLPACNFYNLVIPHIGETVMSQGIEYEVKDVLRNHVGNEYRIQVSLRRREHGECKYVPKKD